MACVLLLNLGGPSTLADVRPFLKNLFSDPMIIRLPGGRLLQPLFAEAISRLRAPKVSRAYAQIGGGSPLLAITRRQASLLGEALARRGFGDACVEVVMRYTEPSAFSVLGEIARRGVRRAVVLPLYPQECEATTASSLADLDRAAADLVLSIEFDTIRSWHLHRGYIAAFAARIREALDRLDEGDRREAILLFSAHGVPESLPKRGDPYVGQIGETVAAVMSLMDPGRGHRLAYQSRTGPVRWVGPGTEEVIRELGGSRCVVVIPIAFVSDHVETLYEIDILYGEEAARAGIKRYVRVESLNDSPLFIQAMADLVEPLLRRQS